MDENYRGNGIGKKLMNRFIDYAKQNNAKSVYLITDENCNWKFYQIVGFEIIDQFDNNVFTELKDNNINYIFAKNLNS